jgi:ABC-type multidrug transport system ATPase subunit
MLSVIVDNLSKNYGSTTAIDRLSFTVNEAELFGFIGPDGAGKTTLFRILTSLLLPDSGSASVIGVDVIKDYKELRKHIGYMPGRFSLYQDLTVEENLKFFATIFGTTIEENYDLVKDIYIQIEPFKTRRAGKLSGGMKQKLALCCALIHKPEILFLDEPTTGVDAVSRKEFWEMLKRLQRKGITIVVSTPYMDEAGLCDRVALIQKGKILDIDTPSNIVGKFNKPLLAVKSASTYQLIESMRQYEHTHSIYPFGEYLHYTDRRGDYSMNDIQNFLRHNNLTDIEMKPVEPNIEDCFMELMMEAGHEL